MSGEVCEGLIDAAGFFLTVLLNDFEELVTEFVGGLDDGAFAVVVPGDELNDGPRAFHSDGESFAQGFAVTMGEVAEAVFVDIFEAGQRGDDHLVGVLGGPVVCAGQSLAHGVEVGIVFPSVFMYPAKSAVSGDVFPEVMQCVESRTGGDGRERGVPDLAVLDVYWAEVEQQWSAVDLDVVGLGEPVVVHPLHGFVEVALDAVFGEVILFEHPVDGAVFVANGELHAKPSGLFEHGFGSDVTGGIVSHVGDAVPVDDDTIDASDLHE